MFAKLNGGYELKTQAKIQIKNRVVQIIIRGKHLRERELNEQKSRIASNNSA